MQSLEKTLSHNGGISYALLLTPTQINCKERGEGTERIVKVIESKGNTKSWKPETFNGSKAQNSEEKQLSPSHPESTLGL